MSRLWKIIISLAVIAALLCVVYLKVLLGTADAADDLAIDVWSLDHIKDIPVAIDVTPEGYVYVAETGQFMEGVGDNRYQPYWFMDDMTSTSVEDRLAYVKKSIADGHLSEEWFSNKDTLRVIRDTNSDGKADSSAIVAQMGGYVDGVMAGVLATDDGILVTSIPNVYRLRDTDGDFKADETEIVSSGYGIRTAFVGHDLHGLTWGPDGKIYYSVGDRGFNVTTLEGNTLQAPMDQGRGAVFRMNPDGSDQELYAWGLRNPQELAFDNYGNLISGDNNSDGGDEARIVYLVEGGDSGWTYGYQYMADSDYLRGPWNAEKMWEPYHKGQPAWIVPPLANETNGPSGVAFYPGLGLPERYNDHFFISNYSFIAPGSWILSFALEPSGAGFALRNVHKFAESDLFIDQDFGFDGKMYAVTAAVFGGPKKLIRLYGEEQQSDPRIEEARKLLLAGLGSKSTCVLLDSLVHADQRLRLHAQFELVRRGELKELSGVASDRSANELARIHALWGLGQLGAKAFEQWTELDVFEGEMLAQAIKVLGEAGAGNMREVVRRHIASDDARISYFATLSAAKLGDVNAVPEISAMLLRNANSDAFLRHAGVMALTLLNDEPSLAALAKHPSPVLRLASLLAYRRLESIKLAGFLHDEDVSVVVEAARAIHDLRLLPAMAELARLATDTLLINSDEPQTSYALHRRVINANLLLGEAHNALALAQYAATESNPVSMRKLALTSLQEFSAPPVADKVWGDHWSPAAREPAVVYEALDSYIPQLLDGELGEQALEVALAYDRLPLGAGELSAVIKDVEASPAKRTASLQALQRIAGEGANKELYFSALENALSSDAPALRSSALSMLAGQDAERAADVATAIAKATLNSQRADILQERQVAIAVLGTLESVLAQDYLLEALGELTAGALDQTIALDVVEAASVSALASRDGRVAEGLKAYQKSIGNDLVIQRRIAMYGGDAEKGKVVFENLGDCLRCHSVNKRGGVAGPALDGIASKFDTDYLYRALVQPAADMAEGFASVALTLQDGTSMSGILLNESADVVRMQSETGHGDVSTVDIPVSEIAEKQGPFSGMPAMGLVISVRDLRDVMAYLASLK
ncbi:MAG: PQQ-dependent sugar dehydrogenase [Pseudomonadales bacterium]